MTKKPWSHTYSSPSFFFVHKMKCMTEKRTVVRQRVLQLKLSPVTSGSFSARCYVYNSTTWKKNEIDHNVINARQLV